MKTGRFYRQKLPIGVLGSLGLLMSVALPGLAAERVTLRVGPFAQSIAVTDLEQFARTGEVPPNLQLYTPFLTKDVQKALNSNLKLDPEQGSKAVESLLRSPAGAQLLQSIQLAVPNLTVEQLQTGVYLAATQASGLNAISVLKALPQKDVTVDVTEAIGIASKLNLPYLQSQTLGPLLEQDLAVNSTPFRVPFDPAAAGPQAVQQQTLTFQDTNRDRRITADLYWSQGTTTGPLVVISPGFEANRTFLAYLARHLASYGFTVAAIEHPRVGNRSATAVNVPGNLIPAREFVDRPQDVHFVLDELAKVNQQPGALQGKLNTQQVSVIGHSLGGYTALALAGAELNLDDLRQFCQQNALQRTPANWLECAATSLDAHRLSLKDARVVQVMALNPVAGRLFGKTGLTSVTVPTLMLTSTADTLAPTASQQLQPFTQLRGQKYLLAAIGATHLSVSDPDKFSGASTTGTLVQERLGRDVANLRQLLEGVSLAFVKQLTPDASTYAPFLTPAYAQSLSTPAMPLRLSTELPSSVRQQIEAARP